MKNNLKKLQKFINAHNRFFVIGHENPDGDCVGSQVALAGLLRKLGKQVFLLSSGPFSDIVAQLYSSLFYSAYSQIPDMPSPDALENSALLCVDTSSYARLGDVAKPLEGLPSGIIDHHVSASNFGLVQYIDSTVPANTILIYRLFEAYGIIPTREDAHFILLGILTDTQFFRFVKAEDTEPFQVASKMVELGVSPGEIYQQIGYGYTFLSRKIIAKILGRASRVNNNRVILTYMQQSDYLYKDDIPQSYEIYQLLQGTQKTEVVVYIQENVDVENKPMCKIGLRSHAKVDVSKIAEEFNGGGHKRASGFAVHKSLSETWDMLRDYFDALVLE